MLALADDVGTLEVAALSVLIPALLPSVASLTHSAAGLTVACDASGSSNSDSVIASHEWHWGDGSTGPGVAATRTYAIVGPYTITLALMDNDGLSGTITTDAISIGYTVQS